MGIGGALRELGRFLDECEQRRGIDSVALADDCSPGATGQVTADVELTLSTCPSPGERRAVSLAGTSVGDDGRLQLTFESVDAVVPERTDGVEVEPAAAAFDADGTVSVTLTASTTVADGAVEDGAEVEDGAAADTAGTADGSGGDEPGPDECSTGRTSNRDGSDGPLEHGGERRNDLHEDGDGAGDLHESVRDGADAPRERVRDGADAPRERVRDGTDDRLERAPDDAKAVAGDASKAGEGDTSKAVAANGSNGTRSDRDVPPFQDPDLLREVYESCDTFAEMSDAIEMDVTAETVRRYMIDAGIHEPNSYDVAGADDADREPSDAEADLQSPVVVTDGIGLPDDVSVDTLVETVRTSSTIYEVKNDVGIGRDEAREMLRQLDLLDHVVGRLATKDERDVSRELVVERLRQNAEPR